MDILATISAAAASLTAIKEVGTAALGAREAHVAQAATLEFMDKLFDAQSKLSQVATAVIEKDGVIASLSQRVRELEAQQSERARYELHELAPGRGVFAYRLKSAAALTERQNEPAHFVCQPCFDGGKKIVLQRGLIFSNLQQRSITVMHCTSCNMKVACE